MHTATLTTRLATLALALTSLTATLRADADYHAPYAPFSVTVHDGSTLFGDNVSFNGSRADFQGLSGLSGLYDQGPTYLSGVLMATFVADPGYVFTNLSMNFGQWSFSNAPFTGANGHWGSWSVPGSTYVGSTNPQEASGPWYDAWSGNGSSGTFSRSDWMNWTGGGSGFLPIMGPWGTAPIQLDYVSSFTLTFDLNMFVYGHSYYSFSNLSVDTVMAVAPPPSNAVPDGPLHPAMFAGVISAILLLGTRSRPHLRGASR